MLTYTYRYNRVIQWFKDHPISKESHPDSEYHHIVPRSCTGEDVEENRILLPTRWHYIVHCWLPAVYLEQGNQEYYEKMLFAWNRMQNYREDFRSGLQTIKEDSWLYQKLRDEYSKAIGKLTTVTQKGDKNSQYGKHWWKDPNDKTKSLSIKEGDPIPEGWVRGRWLLKVEGTIAIYNDETNKCRYIKLSSKDEIPEGWHLLDRIKDNVNYDIFNKEYIGKCRLCGAKKIRSIYHTNDRSDCLHKELCWHWQPVKKLIKYFGFDETAIGTERYYEEYKKAAINFFKMWNSLTISKLANIINWKNKSYAGLYSLHLALSKIFPDYVNLV